jgi:hypothetical protein
MMPKKTVLNDVQTLFLINLFNTYEYDSNKRQLIPNLFFDITKRIKQKSLLHAIYVTNKRFN